MTDEPNPSRKEIILSRALVTSVEYLMGFLYFKRIISL